MNKVNERSNATKVLDLFLAKSWVDTSDYLLVINTLIYKHNYSDDESEYTVIETEYCLLLRSAMVIIINNNFTIILYSLKLNLLQ